MEPEVPLAERWRQLQTENVRLRERARGALTRAGIACGILAVGSETSFLDRVVSVAERLVRARAAGLYLVDPASGALTFVVVHGGGGAGLLGQRLDPGFGFSGECAATGRTIRVDDVPSDARLRSLPETDYVPRTLLCAPMSHEGVTVGVLQLLDKEGDGPFTEADAGLLERFAAVAASAFVLSKASVDVGALARVSIERAGDVPAGFVDRVQEIAAELQASESYRTLAEVSRRISEIGRQGVAARRLCRNTIAAFHRRVAAR